jgi:hypothetical protein
VTVETVPDEVREWLAATFTRQAGKRRKEIKFKSVANAIRTGIMFEKMFRKTTSVIAPIPADLQLIIKVRMLKEAFWANTYTHFWYKITHNIMFRKWPTSITIHSG